MSISITPQLLEAVGQYLKDTGYDSESVTQAAEELREVWSDTDPTIQHGDPVVVTKGDLTGQIGHAVVYGYGGHEELRVRIHGFHESWWVPEGGLQRVIT